MAERSTKYALFDYFESETTDVGLTSNIVVDDDIEINLPEAMKEDTIVSVRWLKKQKGGKRKGAEEIYKARILQLSDDEPKLRQLCADFVSGKLTLEEVKNYDFAHVGKRKKFVPEDSTSEDDEAVEKSTKEREREMKDKSKELQRNASSTILERLKQKEKKVSEDQRSREDLQQDLKRMRKENDRLRQCITAMSYLPHVVQVLESLESRQFLTKATSGDSALLRSTPMSPPSRPSLACTASDLNPSTPTSHASLAGCSRSAASTPKLMKPVPATACAGNGSPGSSLQISDAVIVRCSKANAQKFVNDLMSASYTDSYMLTRSLGGKSSKESSKEGLPAEDLDQIYAAVHGQFPEEDVSRIRCYIRMKLNNVEKIQKRKQQKM